MGQFTEKKWPAVPHQALTSDGLANGQIQVATTKGYYVGMIVSISTDGTNDNASEFKIRQVANTTTLFVSNPSQPFTGRANMTAYTVAGGATITADKQERAQLTADATIKAVYADEPAVALRTLTVDKQGNAVGQGVIPYAFDALNVTSVDGSGNPLTINYYINGLSGTFVGTLTLTYDGGGNLATAAFST